MAGKNQTTPPAASLEDCTDSLTRRHLWNSAVLVLMLKVGRYLDQPLNVIQNVRGTVPYWKWRKLKRVRKGTVPPAFPSSSPPAVNHHQVSPYHARSLPSPRKLHLPGWTYPSATVSLTPSNV